MARRGRRSSKGRGFADEDEVEFHVGADRGGVFFAFEARDGLAEQLAIELKTDADDVAALLRTEEVAGAAKFEVAHGDAETGAELVVRAQGVEAFAADLDQARVAVEEEVGVGLVFETAHASAELVELREAEAVRAFDDDRVAVGDIEAGLDDRGADEDLMFACDEIGHLTLEFVLVHLAVADADRDVG